MRKIVWIVTLLGMLAGPVGFLWAKVDLVTLPKRDTVQLTIYNSADLTLVREVRNLTLKKGLNRLEFGWANTLIDPTSLSLRAIKHPDAVELLDVSYPPRVNTSAIWTVRSELSGEVPVEITFFTSGIAWRAFYMGTLTPDEKTMLLSGYVRVANRSGEDYADAKTRLIVGKIHLIDEIAALARRKAAYGEAEEAPRLGMRYRDEAQLKSKLRREMESFAADAAREPKKVIKEGLSEYFLYTIEGTETIASGWDKRLPSFSQDGIPVVNLYKFEEERYRDSVMRFLYFKNDAGHKLGQTPLPGGLIKVFRTEDEQAHLSYQGASNSKYIPVGQKVELSLGAANKVRVKPVLMEEKKENFRFNRKGNVSGWDQVNTYKVEVKNYRDLPVRVEIKRNFPHAYWELQNAGDFGTYEKEDMDTVKYTLNVEPHTTKTFEYTVTLHEGVRREEK